MLIESHECSHVQKTYSKGQHFHEIINSITVYRIVYLQKTWNVYFLGFFCIFFKFDAGHCHYIDKREHDLLLSSKKEGCTALEQTVNDDLILQFR